MKIEQLLNAFSTGRLCLCAVLVIIDQCVVLFWALRFVWLVSVGFVSVWLVISIVIVIVIDSSVDPAVLDSTAELVVATAVVIA